MLHDIVSLKVDYNMKNLQSSIYLNRYRKKCHNVTYNKMVGKPLIENSVATDVKRVQSILPTRIGIFPAKD